FSKTRSISVNVRTFPGSAISFTYFGFERVEFIARAWSSSRTQIRTSAQFSAASFASTVPQLPPPITASVDLDQKSFFIESSRHAPPRVREQTQPVTRHSVPIIIKKVHILGIDR